MKNYLLLFSIFAAALFIRFYNFGDRITFGPEQARSLIVSSNYIQDKPSLLGQEYFRSNSVGHKLFTSAIFNYSLVPLLLVFKYDPYPITIYFGLLNIFTAIVVYVLTKKMFGKEISIISTFLFLFNSYMIYHSMFIWVLNYLPLLGILSIYYVWKLVKQKTTKFDLLYLGILSGIGFGLEYLYLLAILIIIYYILRYSKEKIKSVFLFVVGGAIGDFTQVIFDVKHNFYHLSSLWQYALDTFAGKSDAGFVYYHFLEFWPLVIIIFAMLLSIVYQRNKVLFYLLSLVYVFINLNSSLVNLNKPVGMENGLKYIDLKNASQIVSKKVSDNFNLVTLYDFDTRAYTLRYFTQYIYGKKPQNDITYKEVSEIYVLANNNYDFEKDNPWELNVFKPYNVERLNDIGEGYALFKLTK